MEKESLKPIKDTVEDVYSKIIFKTIIKRLSDKIKNHDEELSVNIKIKRTNSMYSMIEWFISNCLMVDIRVCNDDESMVELSVSIHDMIPRESMEKVLGINSTINNQKEN